MPSTFGLRRALAHSGELVKSRWVVFVVLALLWLPLCAVCLWLYHNDVYGPHFDLAMMEMRVRDVGTPYTPLLGLPGRLGRYPEVGSHPGPLAFYLLAPLYWVLGGSYWALRTATLALHAGAILGALLLARRRAGAAGVIAVGIVLAIIEVAFGLLVLSEAWNPNLPVLWFFTFLLAVWSVIDGDVKLLPLVAAIASLCAQTHIPYLGVCGLLSAVAFAVVLGRWIWAVREKLPSRVFARSCVFALATACVLWIPPVLDQIVSKRGNFTILFEHFTLPPEPMVEMRRAVPVLLEHLDIGFLLNVAYRLPGIVAVPMAAAPTAARGAEFLGVWLLCAVVAFRMSNRSLKTLYATAAAALVVGFIAISRITGVPWIYVVFFAWSVGGLMLASVLLTLGLRLVSAHAAHARGLTTVATAAALIFIGVFVTRLTGTVAKAGSGSPAAAQQIAALGRDAAAAIQRRAGETAASDRYYVTWDDAFWTGAVGLGLMLELERRGLQVFVNEPYAFMTGEHRAVDRSLATARIHYANAGWIQDTAAINGAVQLAYSDVRSAEQRREYKKIQRRLLEQLRKVGRLDLEPKLDRHVMSVKLEVDGFGGLGVARLSEIGSAGAVFLLPMSATTPGDAMAEAEAAARNP
jgi:hypothetical protein